MSDRLGVPHGGKLVDLVVDADRRAELRLASADWPSWQLSPRQLCDLELLLSGGFSPLRGFLGRADWESACQAMRLTDGTLWPVPVTLDVPETLARSIGSGTRLGLRDDEGVLLAVMHVDDVWPADRRAEAEAVYGTTDREHPGVASLLDQSHPYYVGGRLEGLQLPTHYDFRVLRLTPRELRAEFQRLGWRRAVAFQPRNPMHRVHQELALRAAKEVQGNLLIHPVVGVRRPGDVDHYTCVRCYQAILPYFGKHSVKLALLPHAMRLAGPREALWQAIIAKNHGCTHFVVGPDHAGPGAAVGGRSFYEPDAAEELLAQHRQELGVTMVPASDLLYVEDLDTYLPRQEVRAGARVLRLSDHELRRRLAHGLEVPLWFTFPEVARELQGRYPPRRRQGFTVFFSGLSGAGKSTLAQILQVKFLEMGDRRVTLLDGDIVRRNLSSELGFSREHRDINIRRIGFVAAEITKNGGIALCAPIAPYDAVRKEVRRLIEPWGGFVLVYVSTPLSVCEERDRKGLYAKARAGLVKEFTGISDPYEAPEDAEIVLDTTEQTPEECVQQILLYLEGAGYIGS